MVLAAAVEVAVAVIRSEPFRASAMRRETDRLWFETRFVLSKGTSVKLQWHFLGVQKRRILNSKYEFHENMSLTNAPPNNRHWR